MSKDLDVEVQKIGRVLGPRWAACSLRSAMAVWTSYPALVNLFSKEKKFKGWETRLLNVNFLKDLALMIEILEELNLLSNALQARSVTLPKAEKLIKRSIKALEILKNSEGKYERNIKNIIDSDSLKAFTFASNKKFVALPRTALIDAVMKNLEKRMLFENHVSNQSTSPTSLNIFHLLEPSSWDIENVQVPWKEAEDKLEELSQVLHHQIDVNDFRDFLENAIENPSRYNAANSVRKAKDIIRTIPISSAEAERGFSIMNMISTYTRNSISTSNISHLISVSMLGKAIELWDPTPHVKSWLKNHHIADDTRVKKRATNIYSENELAIWNFV